VEGAGAEGRFACHCAVQSSLLEGRICDDRINRGNRKFGRRPNVILRIGRHSRHWDVDRRRMLRWKEKFEWLVALLMWMLLHCLKVKTLPWLKSYHRARCPGRSPGHPPSCPLRRHPHPLHPLVITLPASGDLLPHLLPLLTATSSAA